MNSNGLKHLKAERKKLLLKSCIDLYWQEREYQSDLNKTKIELPPKKKFPWWEDLEESQLNNIEKAISDRHTLYKKHKAEIKATLEKIIFEIVSIDYQIAIEKQRLQVCPRVRIPNYVIFSLVATHIPNNAAAILKYKTWLDYYQGVIERLAVYHLHPETHSERHNRFYKLVVPSVTRTDNPLCTSVSVDYHTAKYFRKLLTRYFKDSKKRKQFVRKLIKKEFRK